eukprot:755797-Hanusia_phi.AAC.3
MDRSDLKGSEEVHANLYVLTRKVFVDVRHLIRHLIDVSKGGNREGEWREGEEGEGGRGREGGKERQGIGRKGMNELTSCPFLSSIRSRNLEDQVKTATQVRCFLTEAPTPSPAALRSRLASRTP